MGHWRDLGMWLSDIREKGWSFGATEVGVWLTGSGIKGLIMYGQLVGHTMYPILFQRQQQALHESIRLSTVLVTTLSAPERKTSVWFQCVCAQACVGSGSPGPETFNIKQTALQMHCFYKQRCNNPSGC